VGAATPTPSAARVSTSWLISLQGAIYIGSGSVAKSRAARAPSETKRASASLTSRVRYRAFASVAVCTPATDAFDDRASAQSSAIFSAGHVGPSWRRERARGIQPRRSGTQGPARIPGKSTWWWTSISARLVRRAPGRLVHDNSLSIPPCRTTSRTLASRCGGFPARVARPFASGWMPYPEPRSRPTVSRILSSAGRSRGRVCLTIGAGGRRSQPGRSQFDHVESPGAVVSADGRHPSVPSARAPPGCAPRDQFKVAGLSANAAPTAPHGDPQHRKCPPIVTHEIGLTALAEPHIGHVCSPHRQAHLPLVLDMMREMLHTVPETCRGDR